MILSHQLPTESFWLQHKLKIEQWISDQYGQLTPQLYCSVDIRNAGFKAAHVDANIFPAGFNNIHPCRMASVAEGVDRYMNNYFPYAGKILLIAEDFTRNTHYLKNVDTLVDLLRTGDRECRSNVMGNGLITKDAILYKDGWRPDLIVLNSDLSTGIPEFLQEVQQDIIPSPSLGWHTRSKYRHFLAFQRLISKFSQHLGLDEWLLSTHCQIAEEVDFKQKIGLDNLASKVEEILSLIREKYQQYSITQQPYVFVKADHGTFGAGIMTATSGDDILNINKKNRHSMQTINHGIVNSQVLVQEGVPTTLAMAGAAEYVYYLIGGELQFRILRQNSLKDIFGNLNSRGMQLTADAEIPYGIEYILARLAGIATLFEDL